MADDCEQCQEGADCRPCAGCPDCPEPVLPRCNNTLPDGVYANATVTVEGGCISELAEGTIPMYDPSICCSGSGGGGTGPQGPQGPQGPPGLDGTNATVDVAGTVTLPAGSDPEVVNKSGDPSHAKLEFRIPECDCDGGDGSTEGIQTPTPE